MMDFFGDRLAEVERERGAAASSPPVQQLCPAVPPSVVAQRSKPGREEKDLARIRKVVQHPALRKSQAARGKASSSFNAPSKRTPEERLRLSTHMHGAKARKMAAKASEGHAKDVENIFCRVKFRGKVGLKRGRAGYDVQVRFGEKAGRQQFSCWQMQELAREKTTCA